MRILTVPAMLTSALTTLAAVTAAVPAAAQGWREGEVIGEPVPGGIGFQPPVTEIARDIAWMDDMLLIIITAISLFVTALIGYACWRYNEKANPKPARFTHNAMIEVIWTAVPVVILIIIAIPSLRLLFLQLEIPEPEVTIKATGNQWYWSYEYANDENPDDAITFDSFMLGSGFSTWDDLVAKAEADPDSDAAIALNEYGLEREDWLYRTDTHVVVPVGVDVHVLVTGSDVIHNWMIPSFGAKIDAIPGRINETWFNVDTPGIYYGQCSELCGKDHAYMPIVVEAVLPEAYDAWVAETLAAQKGENNYAEAPAE